MSGFENFAGLKVPVEFSCNHEAVLSLMGKAIKDRGGSLPQAYADLLSAVAAFSIVNEREVDEVIGHLSVIWPVFHRDINADRDGMAASIGLFSSRRKN